MTKTFNVICIKWGTYYGAEDVNKLCAAIKRNTSYDVNFYCFTERSEGLNEDIISRPLPVLNVAPELVFGNHRKASGLCDDNLAGLHGQRVFFFDLDSLIVGNLDELFDYPQGNGVYAINDWAHRRGKKANQVAQASCYSWVVGTLGFIKQYYERHAEEVIRTFGTATQQYMSAMIMQKYEKSIFGRMTGSKVSGFIVCRTRCCATSLSQSCRTSKGSRWSRFTANPALPKPCAASGRQTRSPTNIRAAGRNSTSTCDRQHGLPTIGNSGKDGDFGERAIGNGGRIGYSGGDYRKRRKNWLFRGSRLPEIMGGDTSDGRQLPETAGGRLYKGREG